VRFGPSRGDQADVVAAPSVDHHQNSPGGVGSESDKTLLRWVRFVINDGDGRRIFEHQSSLGKTNAVLCRCCFPIFQDPKRPPRLSVQKYAH
jgi:hypothetical protein